jgi:hypothetical protein
MIIYQSIKNFILAWVVCRKYGLIYKPFCSFDSAEYNYIFRYIMLNPFHPEFNSILFHEVGHHVHDKLVNYNTFFDLTPDSMKVVTYNEEQDFHKLIEAEAFASRFAMKTGKANKSFLIWAFNTYTRMPFRPDFELSTKSHFTSYVDCVSKYTLRITNI